MIGYDGAENRMIVKLVYYGPALSGKTTNLLQLHDILDAGNRGDLMVLDTKDDRTIFFDLLPFFLKAPGGLEIKVKVYTVPGQVRHDATRKAVLMRADGVAFIADAQVSESRNNYESFDNLEKNLAFCGMDIGSIPLVIQFNKKDLPGTLPDDEIKKTWGATGIPVFTASAMQGWGVLETFRRLAGLAYEHLNRQFGLSEKEGLRKEDFVNALAGKGDMKDSTT